MFPRMLSFALCLMMATASVTLEEDKENLAKVLGTCDKATSCPENSFCARRGCDGMICMCNIGYQPSEDFAECLKVVELYRSCADEKTRCRGPLAYCEHVTKTCRCMDGYIPANDNIRCKKMPRYGVSYAMLGESCKKDVVICQDSNQQVCSSDTSLCTCGEGLKPASGIDLNAEPFILDECRPEDFSLEVELEECKKPVIIGIALIGQKCNTDNNCPSNSKCKQIGCENRQCRCVNGTAPTRNVEKCKPGVMLHEACNDSVVCLGAYIACIQGKCKCSRGSVEASNNQCKSAPPIPGRIEFAALGEKCNNDGDFMKLCESTVCTEGVCQCPPTMREMTPAEKLHYPNKMPPCIAVGKLTEELSPAEYELRCVELPEEMANLNVLNRTGVRSGVTASWPEERSTDYEIAEDDLEPSEVIEERQTIEVDAPDANYTATMEGEFNESTAIETSGPNINDSFNLMDILAGNDGNSSLSEDEIVERLLSVEDSLGAEFLNSSMGLNSSDPSLDLNDQIELAALNDTFNFLLTNDFEAPDFNESFDAEFLPDDLSFSNESVDFDSLNQTLDSLSGNGLDANNSVNLLDILMVNDGNNSLRADEIVDRLMSLNDTLDSEMLNSSLGLDYPDFIGLNDTFNFLLENDFDAADFNESFDAEFLPEEDFDGNQTIEASELDANDTLGLLGIETNSSLDTDDIFDEYSLSNVSLDSELVNASMGLNSANASLDFELSSLDVDLSNDSSLDLDISNSSLDIDSSNETLDFEVPDGSLSNSSFGELMLNDSLDFDYSNFDNEEMVSNINLSGNYSDTTDLEIKINDFDQTNESQSSNATLNGYSSLLNITEDLDTDTSASSYGTIGEESNTFASTVVDWGSTIYGLFTSTFGPEGTGSSMTEGNSATLSNDGGMEAALQEESPDLGLSISDDGSHFVGSSGDEIEPVNYNNDADEDREEVNEIVEKETFYNRILLEKCSALDVCPPLSQCLDVGCGPPICFCLYSYGPSKDRKSCIKGVDPPIHCNELENFEEIQPNQSSADTAPVAVATTLLCLGLILLLAVLIIYLRLKR